MPYNILLVAIIISIFGYFVSYNRTIFLEKELVRIENEIQHKENVFQVRQAALLIECEKNRLQTELLRNQHRNIKNN